MLLMTIKRNRWKESFSNYWTPRCKIASTRMFSMKKPGSKFYLKFFTRQNTQVLFIFCWKIFYFFNQRPSMWQEILDSRLTFLFLTIGVLQVPRQFQTFSQQLKLWWNFTMNLKHYFLKAGFRNHLYEVISFIFHCTLVRSQVQLKSQQWFHFSFHFVPDILWRSKANWWWLRWRKLRRSKLGALRIRLRKISFFLE